MVIPRRNPGPTTLRMLSHHSRIDWHDHDEHQLLYLHAGVLTVTTPRGIVVLPQGHAAWLPAHLPHTHYAHGTTEFRSVLFPATTDQPLDLTQATVLATSGLLREAVLALSTPSPSPTTSPPPSTGPSTGRSADRTELLRQLVLNELQPIDTPMLRLPEPHDDRLRSLAKIFADHPAESASLAELAARIGSSERTLSRLLHSELGMTFPQWRDRLRIVEAAINLGQGHTIAAIAARAGYSSSSALITAFRHAFGTTPGALQNARSSHEPTSTNQ
jgi:AraC-like DNA-binding protein